MSASATQGGNNYRENVDDNSARIAVLRAAERRYTGPHRALTAGAGTTVWGRLRAALERQARRHRAPASAFLAVRAGEERRRRPYT